MEMQTMTDPLKVLLVEDEPLARRVARQCLESEHCQVLEAETYRDAQRLWSEGGADAVVLDNRLPDGRGLDLLRAMRAEGRDESVIWLSADTEVLAREGAEDLGLFAVLTKSIGTAKLRYAIESLRSQRTGAA
jgi:DNA-binding response OmpR family regulator